MKMMVAKRDLMGALKTVSYSMASGGGNLSACYLFRRKPNSTTHMEVLTGFSRLFSSCPFVASAEGDEEMFTIEGARLDDFLKTVPENVPLTFTCNNGTVLVSFSDKNQSYPSRNPKDFSFWDEALKEAIVTATLPADRLMAALDYSKDFCSEDQSKSPDVVISEVEKGVLFSTNRAVATLLRIKGLENCTLRLHYKDTPSVVKFLALSEGDIEVRERETGMYFLRADGAMFCSSRWQKKFPSFFHPEVNDPHYWVLKVSEINDSLLRLKSGADEREDKVVFTRPDPNGPVLMTMPNMTGTKTVDGITCVESGAVANAPEFPSDGFAVLAQSLSRVLSKAKKDDGLVKFGITPRRKGGYLRLLETKFKEDIYLTIVAWQQR